MRFPEIASVREGRPCGDRDRSRPAGHDRIGHRAAAAPDWPTRYTPRYSSTIAPDWAKRGLRRWPEQARTLAELSRDLDAALRMPGYQMAIAPPIRTRIDMLTTGVRTPVGIKVFGEDLTEIERVSVSLEGLLRKVPGTAARSPSGRPAASISISSRTEEAIARYGLTVRDVQDVVEAAVGGMSVSTAIAGRRVLHQPPLCGRPAIGSAGASSHSRASAGDRQRRRSRRRQCRRRRQCASRRHGRPRGGRHGRWHGIHGRRRRTGRHAVWQRTSISRRRRWAACPHRPT